MQIVSVGIDLGKDKFHLVALGVAGSVAYRLSAAHSVIERKQGKLGINKWRPQRSTTLKVIENKQDAGCTYFVPEMRLQTVASFCEMNIGAHKHFGVKGLALPVMVPGGRIEPPWM